MDNWRPTTLKELEKILSDDLNECDAEQRTAFTRHRIIPSSFPILRYGELDNVFVVARRGNDVMYWEDVEEGFNISPLDTDGRIAQHWCNQNSLGIALNAWIDGRQATPSFGPA